MKKLRFLLVIMLLLVNFSFDIEKDKTKLIAQKWTLVGMELNGTLVNKEMMERQRQQGMLSVIQFTKSGMMYIFIKSPKMMVKSNAGGKTQKNRWKFTENQTKLTITPQNGDPTTTFDIVKLSKKKMILSLEDEVNGKQSFVYEVYKSK